VDRARPGVIAVTRNGRRFVNEANCDHDFVQAMVGACAGEAAVEAWLVCDHRALRRYGLGFVKPFPIPAAAHLRSGYLVRGGSLGELARKLGLDATAFEETVARHNRQARAGQDVDFGKGDNVYNRYMSDPDAPGNPCLAPLDHPPFYAVKVIPGSLGTYAGLRCDRYARVVDAQGQAIAGLYAVGSDMANIAGGNYPAAGANLGPQMTFGYIAARHAAGAN
jgi:succinate dehydrogenase/fumarate reductase flavoprotein subunit